MVVLQGTLRSGRTQVLPHSNLRHFRLLSTGMFVGSDGAHEIKITAKSVSVRTAAFRGLWRFAGVNLNPHEQDHSKQPIYFRSVNTTNFPNFTFAVRVNQ